jgi:hypothetical protein
MTMKTTTRSTSRILATLALGLFLGLGAMTTTASAQSAGKEPPAKEPTDGFFDVPVREDTAEAWGLPAYMVTSALGGAAMFVQCRSARRS